jgi:hypothetical protein
MARTLIICPTHSHADTLLAAIPSVQAQTDPDWELVVIGDGAPARTDEIMADLTASDDRIRYLPHPKGKAYGEAYRDPVVRGSSAEFVCHLGDDDIWHESHLRTLTGALDRADWIIGGDIRIGVKGFVSWRMANYAWPGLVRKSRNLPRPLVFTALNPVAFRRSAYLNLPEGWAPGPPGTGSDFRMWLKFLNDPRVRIAGLAAPTHLKFQSQLGRDDMKPGDRLAELRPWLERINAPGELDALRRKAEIFGTVPKAMAVLDAGRAVDPVAALSRIGIEPVGPEDAFSVAHFGERMTLPLTPEQLDQCGLAWALCRGPVDADTFAAYTAVGRHPDSRIFHALTILAHARIDLARAGADALASLSGRPELARRVHGSLDQLEREGGAARPPGLFRRAGLRIMQSRPFL